jgi:hypothetical protein
MTESVSVNSGEPGRGSKWIMPMTGNFTENRFILQVSSNVLIDSY